MDNCPNCVDRWKYADALVSGDRRDAFLFAVLAEEQAFSEVPRAERIKAYAFLGLNGNETN